MEVKIRTAIKVRTSYFKRGNSCWEENRSWIYWETWCWK